MTISKDREDLIRPLAKQLAKTLHDQFYVDGTYTAHHFTHQEYRKFLGLMAVELHQLIDDEESADLDREFKQKHNNEKDSKGHLKSCTRYAPIMKTADNKLMCLQCKQAVTG